MIKKIIIGVLFLVSVGLPLHGMNKKKPTIDSVKQLEEEIKRLRQEMLKNKDEMYKDMIQRGRAGYNPVVKVDVQLTDNEKK